MLGCAGLCLLLNSHKTAMRAGVYMLLRLTLLSSSTRLLYDRIYYDYWIEDCWFFSFFSLYRFHSTLVSCASYSHRTHRPTHTHTGERQGEKDLRFFALSSRHAAALRSVNIDFMPSAMADRPCSDSVGHSSPPTLTHTRTRSDDDYDDGAERYVFACGGSLPSYVCVCV